MVFSLDMVSGDPRRKTVRNKGAEAGVAHYNERGKSKTRHQGGFQNASVLWAALLQQLRQRRDIDQLVSGQALVGGLAAQRHAPHRCRCTDSHFRPFRQAVRCRTGYRKE